MAPLMSGQIWRMKHGVASNDYTCFAVVAVLLLLSMSLFGCCLWVILSVPAAAVVGAAMLLLDSVLLLP